MRSLCWCQSGYYILINIPSPLRRYAVPFRRSGGPNVMKITRITLCEYLKRYGTVVHSITSLWMLNILRAGMEFDAAKRCDEIVSKRIFISEITSDKNPPIPPSVPRSVQRRWGFSQSLIFKDAQDTVFFCLEVYTRTSFRHGDILIFLLGSSVKLENSNCYNR